MTEQLAKNPEEILENDLTLRSLAEAEHFLYTVLPDSPKALFRGGEGFSRSKFFMREIGDPQEQYKSIHVAGTSGKGSTSYYISGLLDAHGFKVGTHVSPHIYDLRERSMIGLQYPKEKDFLRGINDAMPAIRSMKDYATGRPTYFEVTLGNAFTLFAREQVDYAVIETGLGGRYDSTNTINRSDKLAVITKIGLDHVDVLGDTLEKIAYQKAGIFPRDGEAIILDQQPSVLEVFEDYAKEKGDAVQVVSPLSSVKNIEISSSGVTFDYQNGALTIEGCYLPTIAMYQIENAVLAIEVCKKLAERDGFELDPFKVRQGLKSTVIPGRSEVRVVGNKTVLLDGAHNPQKVKALVDSVDKLQLPKKPRWVLAIKRDKDAKNMLKTILPHMGSAICCDFFAEAPNDRLRDFAMPAAELADLIRELDPTIDVKTISDPKMAFEVATQNGPSDELVVITGSMYFIGELNRSP